MTADALSIGNELRDAYKITTRWTDKTVGWLGDLEEFYRERATLEREYAAKLGDLCKRHFEKKSKVSTVVSVGVDPQVTPGSLESASLVLWTSVLSQTELMALEKVAFASELESRVATGFTLIKQKCSRLIKMVDGINETLLNAKSSMEDDVTKAKRHYDSLCQTTETARERVEKLASEKNQKRLQEKTADMNDGKNDYLIKINLANRLKDKYYYQDVPEILDYLQEINETRVALVNRLLGDAGALERTAFTRMKVKLDTIDQTITQNDPCLDTAMFIKHNMSDWQEPIDFRFIPCVTWHDDDCLVVEEPVLTTLRKRLAQATLEYNRIEIQCLDSKNKLEKINAGRQVDSLASPTLKFDASFISALNTLESYFKMDSLRVSKEVEIEVIQNFAGDKDMTYIEIKAPRKSRFGFLRKEKSTEADGSEIGLVHTGKTVRVNDTGVFNLRRNKTISSLKSGESSCTVLHPYTSGGSDEISMERGDFISIVQHDNGSGWTMVEVNGSGRGLVPSLYIGLIKDNSAEDGQKRRGPAVAPKRGAKRVQQVTALYDYNADGEDELSICAGDRIIVTQIDTENSGWTEGELNGRKGLFPTSYVK